MNLTIRILDENKRVLGTTETAHNDYPVDCRVEENGVVDSFEYELLGQKASAELSDKPIRLRKGQRVSISPHNKKFIDLEAC